MRHVHTCRCAAQKHLLLQVGERLQRVVAAVAEHLHRETYAVRRGEKVLQECLTALEARRFGGCVETSQPRERVFRGRQIPLKPTLGWT